MFTNSTCTIFNLFRWCYNRIFINFPENDVWPSFCNQLITRLLIELLGFLKEKKIIRPKYTTLQTIVSHALTTERNRLAVILCESLTEQDKSSLQELLSKKKVRHYRILPI